MRPPAIARESAPGGRSTSATSCAPGDESPPAGALAGLPALELGLRLQPRQAAVEAVVDAVSKRLFAERGGERAPADRVVDRRKQGHARAGGARQPALHAGDGDAPMSAQRPRVDRDRSQARAHVAKEEIRGGFVAHRDAGIERQLQARATARRYRAQELREIQQAAAPAEPEAGQRRCR